MSSVISLKKERAKLIKKMRKHTHYTLLYECENMVKKYDEVRGTDETVTRNKFREFLFKTFGITDDNLLDRVFRVFDQDNDNKINLEEWIRGMSIYTRGKLDELINFCFQVYDVNADGNISREEMFQFLRQSITSKTASDDDPEEGVRDLIEIALKFMGGEQTISPQVFADTVKREHLWIECLGSCLPSDTTVMEFEETVVCAGQNQF